MITMNHYRRVTLLALLGSWALFAVLFGIVQVFIQYVDQRSVSLMVSMLLSFLFIACSVGPAVTTVIATIRLVLYESGKPLRAVMSGILAVLLGMMIFLLTLSLPGMTDLPSGDTLPQLWWRILANGIPLAFFSGVTLVILFMEFLLQRRIQPRGGNESSAQ